jgi:hypothetical protein
MGNRHVLAVASIYLPSAYNIINKNKLDKKKKKEEKKTHTHITI